MRKAVVTALALGSIAIASAASAQSGTCTPITSLPTTITSSGVYCLTGNLAYATAGTTAITISSDGVVLDFNRFRLRYTGGQPLATAVEVLAGMSNATIRNGFITQFGGGLTTNGLNTIIEDMRFSGNQVIIADGADGAVVRRSYFRDKNLYVAGNSARIVDNDFFGDAALPYMAAVSIAGGKDAFVTGNRMGRYQRGIEFIWSGTGEYRDNVTTDIATPYSGGTNLGNND